MAEAWRLLHRAPHRDLAPLSLALAIDWSGKETREGEFIWLAEAIDGRLTDLCNGWSRPEVIEEVIERAADDSAVVGLDFAFSFPRWWCEERGWEEAEEVWRAARKEGEGWLKMCADPFWGRTGVKKPLGPEEPYRKTEQEMAAGAKSVFQIGGAGAVGTGSIRGMPHLSRLAEAGFSIWPFDGPSDKRVVEIYPRALTGPVNKSRWRERHEFLEREFPEQEVRFRERAAGSEDAFDAAVSALVMSRHERGLRALEPASSADYAIEGRIWAP